MATMTDFSGHTVLVTGGSAGIGLGIGAAFHAAGARVALGDVNTNGLGRAAERLGASDRVFTQVVDVRDASSVEKFIPWGRAGTPADVAHAALFLASPEADFITGEVLSVDGGSGTGRTYLSYSRTT
jgi:3-oxoacyl-[acyl-carrier protein] reductase